jgi:hypothetical protein
MDRLDQLLAQVQSFPLDQSMKDQEALLASLKAQIDTMDDMFPGVL